MRVVDNGQGLLLVFLPRRICLSHLCCEQPHDYRALIVCMASLYRSRHRLILTCRWRSGLSYNARARMQEVTGERLPPKYLRWILSFMERSLGSPITNFYGFPMTVWRRDLALCGDVSNPASPYTFFSFRCRQLRYTMRNTPFTANPRDTETGGATNWGGLPVRS